MRQKIKVSNHSATRLVRNLAETKCTQSKSLFSIRCYGDHAEMPNRNLRKPLEGWLFCYDMLASHPSTTRNYQNCQPPPISSGNIGKWLPEIFFCWKNYSVIHILPNSTPNHIRLQFETNTNSSSNHIRPPVSTSVKPHRASHLAGPGSIPGRVSFPGWGFPGFSSTVRHISGNLRRQPASDIIGHHNN